MTRSDPESIEDISKFWAAQNQRTRDNWPTPGIPCLAAYTTCRMLPEGNTEVLHADKVGAEHIVSYNPLPQPPDSSPESYALTVRRTKLTPQSPWHQTILIEATGPFPKDEATFELDRRVGVFVPWTLERDLCQDGQSPEAIAKAVFNAVCWGLANMEYESVNYA